jgi:DNA-binding IclR family transcriptional regulator
MASSLAVVAPRPAGGDAELGVAAVNRALRILGAFSREHAALTLAQLAARTKLHKSTILRLAESLIGFGYLTRSDNGVFHIGPASLRLGTIYMDGLQSEDEILPVLRGLSQKSKESAAFYVRAGDARLCAFRVRSPRAITDNVQQGELLPLSRGAGGLVLLAFAGQSGRQFDAIRTHGLVVTRGQRDSETAAIACPVFGVGHRLEGALSISGPMNRFDAPATARMARLLRDAASHLTNRLGGDPIATLTFGTPLELP